MSAPLQQSANTAADDEAAIRSLYQQLLNCWNLRDGEAFAALFVPDGEIIGFDGSQMNGQTETALELQQIFANHQTPTNVGSTRSVRLLAPGFALLRGVAGMVPPGQSDIDPSFNVIHTLLVASHEDQWRVVLYQNTPAQFHGRPELTQQLTEELRQLLGNPSGADPRSEPPEAER